MKMRRRSFTLALAVLLALGALPAGARAEPEAFAPIRTYDGQFADVPDSAWFYQPVASLYELGLTNGKGEPDVFDPEGELTVAEVAAMASRLRSLYETGDSEAGRDAYGGGIWYLPYVSHLQGLGVIGGELEGRYDAPATRAEMAHVLAGTLPEELLDPVNRETVAAGYESGRYIRDVTADTPYREDILLLYDWGVAGGVDEAGSFQPTASISRCQAAAIVARLAYGGLRLTLDWDLSPAPDIENVTMASLVSSDGSFYRAPDPSDREQVDADIRYMLSRGERRISLEYTDRTMSGQFVDRLLSAFLEGVRDYVEQTYNSVTAPYSPSSGRVVITFSSSLYDESQLEYYRDETLTCALEVRRRLREDGTITGDMSDYEKARAYFAWICGHCRYDFNDSPMSHSGYQAFTTGLAVCDGYTAAYNLLLKLEGIPCGTYSTTEHIWTVAELDGERCHIDTTWGDQPSGVDYRFFGMTESFALNRF